MEGMMYWDNGCLCIDAEDPSKVINKAIDKLVPKVLLTNKTAHVFLDALNAEPNDKLIQASKDVLDD